MKTISAKIREAVARLHAQQPFKPDHRIRRAPLSEFPQAPPSPEDASLRQALAAIADEQFCLGIKYTEQQMRADRRNAHPDIDDFGRLLVKRMRRLHVPMFEVTLWRSQSDQDVAYVLGNSKARGGQSPHNYSCAVDVIHGIKGWNLTKAEWSIIGHVGKEIAAQRGFKLTWGGDWTTLWDPAHWELTDWRALKHAR